MITTYLFLSWKLSNYTSKLFEYEDKHLVVQRFIGEIEKNVINLTKLARLYVATENSKYLESYFKVLDIRNGYLPTPENYSKRYWNSSIDELEKTDQSNSLPIRYRIERLPFDEFEKSKLLESEKNLEKLIDVHLEAFNSLKGIFKTKKGYFIHKESNREFATKILHSNKYIDLMTSVINPINDAVVHFNKRIENQIRRHRDKIEKYNRYISRLALFQFLFLIFLSISIRIKILRPANQLVRAIKNLRKNINDDTPVNINIKDEIGLVASEFVKLRNRLQEEIKEKEEQYRVLEEYIKLVDENVITSSTDVNGYITKVSQAFIDISGYSKSELISRKHGILRSPNMSDEFYIDLWKTISNGKVWRGEIENIRKDGTPYWVRATIYPNFNDEGNIIGYTSIRVDITTEKMYEKLLDFAGENERALQQYIKLVDENVISSHIDLEGNIVSVSKALIDISGYSEDELIGQKNQIASSNLSQSEYNHILHHLMHHRTWRGEIRNMKKDGSPYWTKVVLYQNLNKYGEIVGYTSIGIDITDKKRIEELSIKDDLTKLYNRRYFQVEIVRAIREIKETDQYITLALIDIDYFHLFNSEYGHIHGDNIIKVIGNVLKMKSDGKKSIPFRLNGEEFAIIYISKNGAEILDFFKDVKSGIDNLKIENRKSDISDYITVSIGVYATKWFKNISDDEIYRQANALLVKAKEEGRNRIISNIKQ